MISKLHPERWHGEYVYGEGYPESVAGQAAPFEIDITCADNNHFTGFCYDDISRRMEGIPAAIEGYIENDSIYFTKRYAYATYMSENGFSWAFPNRPSHDVHYTGNWYGDMYAGEWEIFTLVKDVDGSYVEQYCTGTWFIRKVLPETLQDRKRTNAMALLNKFFKRIFGKKDTY